MNFHLMSRYLIELAMIIPASAMAVIPVYYTRKVNKTFLFGLMGILFLIVLVGGAVLCTLFELKSNTIIFPSVIIFFLAYHVCFDLPLSKKIFCFANAMMLCAFSITYTTFLTAPIELDNLNPVFKVSSGLTCLGIAVITGCIFGKVLAIEFPELLETDSLDSMWNVLMTAPIVATVAIIWMNPLHAENVMTGRLRSVCIVILWSIPLITLFLYHIFWWLAKKLTETAKLQQNYDLLKMEEKQYQRTLQYLRETSNARHDFRHHIHVIEEFLQTGDIEKLKEYIAQFSETINITHKVICNNQAVDAIANYYDEIAKAQNVKIYWTIKIGEELPIQESDICAVIGNLVENAIHAASALEGDNRLIYVRIGILKEETLVISIENAYRGILILNKRGLPVTSMSEHGIGLRSVRNIVEKYKGSMEIETHNQLFKVSILMYAPD